MVINEIDKKEALSYLGCNSEPDENTKQLLEKYEKILIKNLNPRYTFKIQSREQNQNPYLIGNDIQGHLKSSEKVVYIAATLGNGIDNLLRTTQLKDMAGAIFLNALANAAIEQVCDTAEEEILNKINENFKVKNKTTRYSPGYGDFPLTIQGELLNFLNAGKTIGLTVSENNLLIPTKSVTAIFGIETV